MALVSTNMSDLIGRMKTVLSSATASGQSLYGIKTIKRGVLPPRNQFPLITLIPNSESIVSRSSGGLVRIKRDVGIYVFGQDRQKDDKYGLQAYADKTVEVLRANRHLPDGSGDSTVIHAEFTPITFESDATGIEIEGTYISEEQLPARTASVTTSDNPTPNAVGTAIHDALKALQSTTLSGIQMILREQWGGDHRRRFPSLTVVLEDHWGQRIVAGYEDLTMSFLVSIYSKVASAADSTLLSHLELVSATMTTLHAEASWSGTCDQSLVEGVNYNSVLDDNEMLYESQIRLRTTGRYAIT